MLLPAHLTGKTEGHSNEMIGSMDQMNPAIPADHPEQQFALVSLSNNRLTSSITFYCIVSYFSPFFIQVFWTPELSRENRIN